MKYSMSELSALSDEEVLRLSRKNPDIFAELVSRYESAFMRKAKSILFTREDAEEVVQDAFTRMYVYADSYRAESGAQFSSWAYTILTRLCFTRYQKLKRARSARVPMDTEQFERIADTESADFEEVLTIRNEAIVALSKIPTHFAKVLRMQFIEGKTQEEMAEQEGISVGAVKARVHRAKQALRETLNNEV